MTDNDEIDATLNHDSLVKEKNKTGKLTRTITCGSFTVEHYHDKHDPNGIDRIAVRRNKLLVEILPSQGMAIRRVLHNGKEVLWDPPVDVLPDPDTLDISAPLLIEGEEIMGYNMVTTLASGVMMFGLFNWGMPCTDKKTGRLCNLHGEVSNIPVHDVELAYSSSGLRIDGEFVARTFEGPERVAWYKRGKKLFSVVKRIVIDEHVPRILLIDTITNVSGKEIRPSWGYTIKLRPEQGATYLVPSSEIENRFGDGVDAYHETWKPAQRENIREERGYVHRGLKATPGILNGHEGVETLFRYRDGSGTLLVLPKAPYFLSWYSAGGKGDTTIMKKDDGLNTATSIFEKNWDGAGPEFGNDALDHDENIDRTVPVRPLKPGENQVISMCIEMLDKKAARNVEERIVQYNRNRLIKSI